MRVWYHQGVYHPTKRKLRVIFDCVLSFQDVSLNVQLGTDLKNSLVGLVIRFRKEPIVLMSDIKAMFQSSMCAREK